MRTGKPIESLVNTHSSVTSVISREVGSMCFCFCASFYLAHLTPRSVFGSEGSRSRGSGPRGSRPRGSARGRKNNASGHWCPADVINPQHHSILCIRRSIFQHFSSEIRLLAMCLANRNTASFDTYKLGISSFRNMHAAE